MSSQENRNSPAVATLGFPHLERLVEQENFDELNEIFLSSYDRLEAIKKGKADPGRKRAAQKAMRALELTMNLLRDFLDVKEDLLRKGVGGGGSGTGR